MTKGVNMLPDAIPSRWTLLLAGALAVAGCAAEPRADVREVPAPTLADTAATTASLPASTDTSSLTAEPPSAIPSTAAAIPTEISPATAALTGELPPATAAPSPAAATLADFGPAPELSNDTWLNANAPIRLADLRGKVVLIEFWTYG